MHEAAVFALNQANVQFFQLLRTILSAMEDKKITAMEGFSIGFAGMSMAGGIIPILQPGNTALHASIREVLTRGTLTWSFDEVSNDMGA